MVACGRRRRVRRRHRGRTRQAIWRRDRRPGDWPQYGSQRDLLAGQLQGFDRLRGAHPHPALLAQRDPGDNTREPGHPMIEYLVSVSTLAVITAILSLGLNVRWGWSGDLDLAYYAFVALGAYTTGVITSPRAPGGYSLSLIHISEPTRQAEISYAVF